MDNQGTAMVDVPSNIVINGQEYSPEDAQAYIERGKRTMELEKEWNTPVDKVWPEYGKTREQLKTLQTERDQAKQQLAEFQEKQTHQTETPADVKQAREAAKNLGIVLNEDIKDKYIDRDQLETYLSDRDRKREAEKSAIQSVLSEAEKLEKEIDGTDGRPKFNKKAVLGYAAATNMTDLKSAYEDMHSDVLTEWKSKQVELAKKKGLSTLKPGGAKTPTEVKPNNDNLSDMLRETLWGAKE